MHKRTTRCEHCGKCSGRRVGHQQPGPSSLHEVPTNSTRAGATPRTPGGAHQGGGNRAETSQPRAGQSTSCGDVQSSVGGGGGGQASETGVGAHKGHPGAPTDRGRCNTATQNAGATLGGMRASAVDEEEGGSEAGEATRTAGTGNQNAGDGRACAWGAVTTQGMAWPASPVATGCQGNPCSTGIRWGVSPQPRLAVCATGGGAHQGQTSREEERDGKGPPAHTPHQHPQPTQGRPGPPHPTPGPPSPTQCTPAPPLHTIGTLAVEETY